MQAPNAKSKASVSIRSSFPLVNKISVGSLTQACLSILKALFCPVSYLNSVSFRVSLVSSKAFNK